MKKTKNTMLTLITAFLLAFSLAGCGDSNTTIIPEGGSSEDSTAVLTEVTTETAVSAAADNTEFNEFLKEEFIDSVSDNTLSLHYSLKNPAAYGIDLEPTFGDLDFTNTEQDIKDLKETLTKLSAFDYSTLSAKQQLDYDIIKTYIEDNLETTDFDLYGSGLGTVSGVQCNMPINFAEYKFYVERDITDYLSLLTQIPDYFKAVLDFEQKRIDAGLGLQDFQLDKVIEQCESVLKSKETNYLITTFEDRIDAFEGIDDAKKEEYKKQNKDAILNDVLPAYESMIDTVKTFYGKAKIDGGLAKLPDGKEYYEKLVRYDTGSAKNIDEIITLLDESMQSAVSMMYAAATADYEGYTSYFDDDAVNYGSEDPGVLLDTLKLAMMEFYPEGPQTQYTIKYVEKELEDSLSPAFYMVPPIDDTVENVIYINNGSTDKSGLFTTLAHEGYPGHLYQTNYYNSTNPAPIRSVMNFNGYVEGWATYVEMQSPELFTFPEHNAAYTLMEKSMTKLNLVVSSRVDVGVNYEGWSLDDVKTYLNENGLNESIAKEIYEYVICEPANYLKYCVSALEFMELQDYAKTQLGDAFDMKEFNKALLDCGPCQFEYVKRSVDNYISAVKNN